MSIPECPERGHDLGEKPHDCRTCHEHCFPGVCFECGERLGTNDDCHECRRYVADAADDARLESMMGK